MDTPCPLGSFGAHWAWWDLHKLWLHIWKHAQDVLCDITFPNSLKAREAVWALMVTPSYRLHLQGPATGLRWQPVLVHHVNSTWGPLARNLSSKQVDVQLQRALCKSVTINLTLQGISSFKANSSYAAIFHSHIFRQRSQLQNLFVCFFSLLATIFIAHK